jgi:hypothetical protein
MHCGYCTVALRHIHTEPVTLHLLIPPPHHLPSADANLEADIDKLDYRPLVSTSCKGMVSLGLSLMRIVDCGEGDKVTNCQSIFHEIIVQHQKRCESHRVMSQFQ